MVTRQKLELEINTPVQIELLYNEPVIGQSTYGNYYLFAIRCDGKEFSYFAPEAVYEELKNLKAGDTAIITKLAAQRGNKLVTKYVVESNGALIKEIKPTPTENESLPGEEEEQYQTDKYYQIMLKSLKDSLRIQEEVGFVDMSSVIRLSITLFIQRSR